MLVLAASEDEAQAILSFDALQRRSLLLSGRPTQAVFEFHPILEDAECYGRLRRVFDLHLPHAARIGEVPRDVLSG